MHVYTCYKSTPRCVHSQPLPQLHDDRSLGGGSSTVTLGPVQQISVRNLAICVESRDETAVKLNLLVRTLLTQEEK